LNHFKVDPGQRLMHPWAQPHLAQGHSPAD
jgi:hypothetical protein